MDISIEEGSLLLDIDEVLPVLEKHHSIYQPCSSLPPFKLDVPTLLFLEGQGLFLSSKVMIDGKLEGFMSTIKCPSFHYEGVMFGKNNVMYINPNLKNKIKLLKSMIEHHEELVKDYGIEYLELGASYKKDISPLLEKLGYIKTEIINTKRL